MSSLSYLLKNRSFFRHFVQQAAPSAHKPKEPFFKKDRILDLFFG